MYFGFGQREFGKILLFRFLYKIINYMFYLDNIMFDFYLI